MLCYEDTKRYNKYIHLSKVIFIWSVVHANLSNFGTPSSASHTNWHQLVQWTHLLFDGLEIELKRVKFGVE